MYKQDMRKIFKEFRLLRTAVSVFRSAWKTLRNNPDFIGSVKKKIFEYNYEKPTLSTPTLKESALIETLRAQVRALPTIIPNSSTPQPERKWINKKNELKENILTKDPRNFINWSVVTWNMGATIRRTDFKKLEKFHFWNDWSEAIATIPPINRYPYFEFPKTDGTTLLHCYHLAQLKKHFDRDVSDMDLIIDFGAGYGSMCAVVKALGFKGRYVCFDFPEFLLLQKFYLTLIGVDTSNVKFVSTIEELKKKLGVKRGLFIATWSISEISEGFREKIFNAINPRDYIIGYQREVGGVDNNAYFRDFVEKHSDVEWRDYPIVNLTGAGDRYLIGCLNSSAQIGH